MTKAPSCLAAAVRTGLLRSLLATALCCVPVALGTALGADEIKVPDNETPADPRWLLTIPEDVQALSQLHGVLYERWDGIPGPMVRDLLQAPAFKQPAGLKGVAPQLEFPAGDGKDFGVRARGYITPRKSGKVRFFLSSDDNAEVWLSPSADPFLKKEICWVTGPGWFGSTPRDLTNRISTQWSAPVEVVAGQAYYVEAYHKEAAGDDHFELYWQYEDDKDPSSIASELLHPYAGNAADANDDGLPDDWQNQSGLAASADSGWWQDADGDQVSNFDEYTGRTSPVDAAPVKGAVLLETWYGTVGQDVADLFRDPRFLGPAHRSIFLTDGSVTPKSDASFNGTRMSGCIVPKETGDYEFSVAGDDGAELWLSSDACPLNKKRVAFDDHWRGKEAGEEWLATPAQQTAAIHLEAGHAYYFEVLQKDKVAPGWSALGWRQQGEKKYVKIMPEFLQSPGIDPQDPERRFLPGAWLEQSAARATAARRGTAQAKEELPELTEHGDPDRDGLDNAQEAALGTDPYARTAVPGSLLREWWFNVPGVSLLRTRQAGTFLQPPSMRTLTPGAVSEANTVDYFASRLRGQIEAPVAGTYRFWIAGDDHCELWLSDTDDKFSKRRIAWITPDTWESPDTDAWTDPQQWDARPQQQSELIELEEGERRFLEVLHKEAGDKDHVEIAWQYRPLGSSSWSERQVIPASAISSYAGDDDDLDDDYLPDSWEVRMGLDPNDNGSKDHAKQGEDGDFDKDGLTNREEYLLGTDPCNADSDGDGVGDYDEVKLYGSNPTKQDASPPVKDRDLALAGFHAIPGNWAYTADNTVLAVGRRGTIRFDFDLTEAGVYMVQLDALIRSQGDYAPPIPVTAKVDGDEVGRGEVAKTGSSLRWLTPWLAPGHHTVTIDNRNLRLGLALEITGVSLYRHAGEDLDHNGIPDWMEGLFQNLDGVTTVVAESATSPACIEGKWRIPGDVQLFSAGEEIPAHAGLTGRWFADVPLASSGDTTLTANFEHQSVHQQTVWHWIDTNLFECPAVLRVRLGDSLKLTAVPSGSDGAGTHVTYTLGSGPVGEGEAATGTVVTFDHPGSWTLTAHTVTGTEALDANVTVEVLGADFGPGFSVASGSPRLWNLPGVSSKLAVESDPELELQEIQRQDGQSRQFSATYEPARAGEPAVLARLYPAGPVVAATTVDAFYIAPATQTLDARVVAVLPDGTRVVDFALAIDGKIPADLSIWLRFYVTDALFADGSTRWHLTAADFDKDGVAHLTVYKAPGSGTAWVCHYITPYSDDPDPDATPPAEPPSNPPAEEGGTPGH